MFVAVDKTGKPLYTIIPSNEQDFQSFVGTGEDVLFFKVIGSENIDISATYFDFSAGALVRLPEKPVEHAIFDYISKAWVDPRTPESEWKNIRAERDRLLKTSDWTQLPDVPLATKEAWATYRQALRDITEQPDPFNIVWPTPPA